MDLDMPGRFGGNKGEARAAEKAAADAKVWDTANQLVAQANYSPVNGTQEHERVTHFHESAAVARALLTECAQHEAWRKRAEEAEAKLARLSGEEA